MKRTKTLNASEILPSMTIETASGSWGYVNTVVWNDTTVLITLAGDVHMTLGASQYVYELN